MRSMARSAQGKSSPTLEKNADNKTCAAAERRSWPRASLSRKHLRLASALFDRSKEGIVLLDDNNQVQAVNAAYEEITGYDRQDLIGRPLRLLSIGSQVAYMFAAMARDMRQHGHWQGETWKRHRDGTHVPVRMSLTRVRENGGGTINQIAVFNDISLQNETKLQLHQMAYMDALTGLPNRACFYQHVERLLFENRCLDISPSILMIDLDEFKEVNDTMGHGAGDLLLKQVALRMKSCLRANDMLSRFGGDEFMVLIEDSGRDNHTLVADKILSVLHRPFKLGGNDVYVRASLGIYRIEDGSEDIETLIQKADIAMYQAKKQGKDCYRLYDRAQCSSARRKAALISALHQALGLNQMHLNYQVQVHSLSGKPVGMEALLRWTHPEFGNVQPDEFIPLAESCGLILPIGEWVIQAACRQRALWHAQGVPPLPVAVNVSADQFYDDSLVARIIKLLADTHLNPSLLEIEITESATMSNPEKTIAQLHTLRDAGVSIAIDDFGTGYSSLGYLKKLPVAKLKVDRSFVKDIATDSDDRSITNAVIKLAHTMNLKVVAEGVENEQVRRLLVEQGCDYIQGYLFSRPVPADQIPAMLRSLQGQTRATLSSTTKREPQWCPKPCNKEHQLIT